MVEELIESAVPKGAWLAAGAQRRSQRPSVRHSGGGVDVPGLVQAHSERTVDTLRLDKQESRVPAARAAGETLERPVPSALSEGSGGPASRS
jgi:hypothetical protein